MERNLDKAKRVARDNLVEARRLVAALWLEILESSSLPEALRRFAERWSKDTAVRGVSIALKGSFLCSRAVLSDMMAKEFRGIINVSSVNALGYCGNEAYSAAKAGILNLTRNLDVR